MAWKKILLEGDAAVLSDTAPANADFAAAGAGTNAEASRQDHKHDLTEGATGNMKAVDGTGVAIGTHDAVSHIDHIHALGPLVAALDCNQNMLDGAALEKALTGPDSGNEVEGQVWYNNNTGSQHAYVWVP